MECLLGVDNRYWCDLGRDSIFANLVLNGLLMLTDSLSSGLELGQASTYSASLLGTKVFGDMLRSRKRFLQGCTLTLTQDSKYTSDSLANVITKAMMH